MEIVLRFLLILLIAGLCPEPVPVAAESYEGVLKDPVVRGGWLYRSRCVRCHGEYEEARVAENFDDRRELMQAIGEGGCRVSWQRRSGGEFGRTELSALAEYMLIWEENENEPELPELPPLLPEKPFVTAVKEDQKQQQKEPNSSEDEMDPVLRQVLESNHIAMGGWLYTANCYRCHLTYEKARMGKGLSAESIQRVITEGKTSTQMQAFSRLLGGNLKNSEIKAVVSYITSWEEAGESIAIAPALMTPPALDPSDYLPIKLQRFKRIQGDPAAGAEIFSRSCAECHGRQGEGYIGSSLREGRWNSRSDLLVKSVIKNGVPKSLMKSWDQNKGGTLSAKDIDDVTTYLRALEESPDT